MVGQRLSPTALAFALFALGHGTEALASAESSRITGEQGPICVLLPPPPVSVQTAASASHIIFLNRCPGGCNITAGDGDNALQDKSSIPGTDSTLTEFSHGDALWNEVLECVREIYLPYAVTVTDIAPDPLPHHEAMVAGTALELGIGGGIGGVALAGCEPRDNVISFTFANFYSADARVICEVVAQESGHAFGLDHALNCLDPLTYLDGCGLKFFRDRESPCGEFIARECACGGATQNSHQKLLAVLGPGASTPAPVPTILVPADNEVMEADFAIYAEAVARRGIGSVELWINGMRIDSKAGQTNNDRYVFDTADYRLADGVMDVELRASDDLGSWAAASVTVTLRDPCTNAVDCLDGQVCTEGRCATAPPEGDLGSSCQSDQDCISGLCHTDGFESRCSATCSPAEPDACSDESGDFECIATAAAGYCWLAQTVDPGGCCTVSRSRPNAGQIALIVLVAWACFRRPRTRLCARGS